MIQNPIFIGGAGRSGTTLLRAILDSHSRIACGEEFKIAGVLLQHWRQVRKLEGSLGDAQTVDLGEVDQLYRQLFLGLLEPYRIKTGKQRIAEKTPTNIDHFLDLHALFPDAHFIHVVRDGRDVVASLQRMNWIHSATGQPVAYTRDVAEAARYWKKCVSVGRAAGHGIGGRYCELRYEGLVRYPEEALRTLFALLGEPWEPSVLAFHEKYREKEPNAAEISKPISPASIGRWRSDLNQRDVAKVEEIAGPLLEELGYLEVCASPVS